MKVRLIIEDINKDYEDYFTDLIYQVIDKMISSENNNKVDSIIINFQSGEKEEIR